LGSAVIILSLHSSSSVRLLFVVVITMYSCRNFIVSPCYCVVLDFLTSLGAFAKLRKATISFVMSVRLEQLGFHWTDFHEMWYFDIFRKSVQKIQVLLKSDENNWHFT
jgi:hypothetical protein